MLLFPRQVHLDFHTSEYIPDVAAHFDPAVFARQMQEAAVSSVTVFARCHHGWLYYPSEQFPERIHPNLKRQNLMMEQIKALHAAGIRAPVYITVQWDYYTACRHPEWLIRKPDGSHEGDAFHRPGFYQSLCVNTEYADFVKKMTAEVCLLLADELDGIFFDIVGIRPCWCSRCRVEMKKAGIDQEDEVAVRAFSKQKVDQFKEDMSTLVRSYSRQATLFYNAGHVGPCTSASRDAYSHFELESLPSGSWGYLHFPVTARYARRLERDCLGMTGKFHTEWGDFHSLKNQAALEFECFRMLSFGFACSIGDQLEPDGRLNPATYKLIGQVYREVARREAWARPAEPVVEAALISPESPDLEHQVPDSIMGAVQLLEECALQFDIIDPDMDYAAYKLLILPDDLSLSERQQEKIDRYVAAGGRVLACMHGGLSSQGRYPQSFAAVCTGLIEPWPDFLVARGSLAGGLEPDNRYVIYQQGARILPDGAEVRLTAQAPYFSRQGDHFCSHRYTPAADQPPYPAALQHGQVILFAHPLFRQYRLNAPRWCKTLVDNALSALLPSRLIRHNGPSTLSAQLLHQPQQRRINLHLLSYIPVRKSATMDLVEERTPVYNLQVKLSLPVDVRQARLVPDDQVLTWQDGQVTIPCVDGYAVVEFSY